MAVLSKRDFALLLTIILDRQLIKTLQSDAYTRICTQLTFDLILGLLGISRLGIHPNPSKNTSRYTLSMDAKMYSKMPTEFFSQALDGQL